jgi:hypothetical protein
MRKNRKFGDMIYQNDMQWHHLLTHFLHHLLYQSSTSSHHQTSLGGGLDSDTCIPTTPLDLSPFLATFVSAQHFSTRLTILTILPLSKPGASHPSPITYKTNNHKPYIDPVPPCPSPIGPFINPTTLSSVTRPQPRRPNPRHARPIIPGRASPSSCDWFICTSRLAPASHCSLARCASVGIPTVGAAALCSSFCVTEAMMRATRGAWIEG